MKNRGILALSVATEELDAATQPEVAPEVPPMSDDAVDAAVAETSAEIDGVESDAADIEEAEQISDVLDTYETQLGGEPEARAEGEGETPAEGREEGREEAPAAAEGETPAEGREEAPAGAEGETPAEGREEGREEAPAAAEGEGERAEFVPPSEETLKAIEVAVEHFRVRLGYPKRVFPAMEGFAANPDAIRDRALKNVSLLNGALKKNLAVAEEGLIDRAGNAINRAFSTHLSVAKNVDAALGRIEANGVNGRSFEDAAWARIFAASGKQSVSAGDVEALLKKYSTEFHSKALPMLAKAARTLAEVSLSLKKSDNHWIKTFAKSAEVQKIKQMERDFDQLSQELNEYASGDLDKKASVTAEALTQEQAMHLGKLAREVALDKTVTKAKESIGKDVGQLSMSSLNSALSHRVVGGFASDVRAAFAVLAGPSKKLTKLLTQMAKVEFHLIHGVSKYLRASAK